MGNHRGNDAKPVLAASTALASVGLALFLGREIVDERRAQSATRPAAWVWNAVLVAGLAFEACEKSIELGHHLTAIAELDAALLVVVLVNVLNHAARLSDIGHRVNRAGVAAIGVGIAVAGVALWAMWHEITAACG
jgi:hypothetical protein